MPYPTHLRTQCLITGCTLFVGNSWQSGDLFKIADTYIFNAVGDPNFPPDRPIYSKSVTISQDYHHNYFERRNVFVFAKESAVLNHEAIAYIAKAAA